MMTSPAVLADEQPWLVARHVLLLGALGLVVGFTNENVILSAMSGILMGMFWAKWAPIWRRPETADDSRLYAREIEGPGWAFRYLHWLIVVLVAVMTILSAVPWVISVGATG